MMFKIIKVSLVCFIILSNKTVSLSQDEEYLCKRMKKGYFIFGLGQDVRFNFIPTKYNKINLDNFMALFQKEKIRKMGFYFPDQWESFIKHQAQYFTEIKWSFINNENDTIWREIYVAPVLISYAGDDIGINKVKKKRFEKAALKDERYFRKNIVQRQDNILFESGIEKEIFYDWKRRHLLTMEVLFADTKRKKGL